MSLFSVGGVVFFMFTALAVGVRLLVLAWRTRKLPELLLALATLCTGFLCFAVGTAAKLLIQGTPELRGSLTIVGLATECFGQTMLVAFSWRVFHSEGRRGSVLAALLGGLIAATFAGELASGEYRHYSDAVPISGPYVPLGLIARGLAPVWMSAECLRYHRQLKLRLAIGLAEPIVVHRVALWGVAMGASAVGYATSLVHRWVFGTGLREHVWAVTSVSFLGTISAVALGLAFFPPPAYRRWVEAANGETAAGAG